MSLRSPFLPLPVPEVPLHRQFFKHFREHADKIALVDDLSGKVYTYSDVIQLSKAIASGLVKMGVQKGDVFALYSCNTPELVIMMWAVFSTGATVTSCNPQHTAYELRRQLVDAGAKFIYTSNELLPTAIEASNNTIPLKNIVSCTEDDNQLMSFDKLEQDNGSEWPALETMEFNVHEDPVILLYSSGTTGMPKGVPLTHYNVLYNSIQKSHPDLFGPVRVVSTMVSNPLYHAYPFAIFVCGHMAHGGKLIVQPKFDIEQILKGVEKHKVTHLYLVSSALVCLAKSPLVDKYDHSSLQEVYSAGASVGSEVKTAFCSKMGLDQIKQAYGMTEATFIAFNIYNKKTSIGSVGVLVPGFEGQVVDLTTGEALAPHRRGELCIKGPHLMKGYLNRPEATKQAFDSDGWFHTGDVAYYDEDNYLYIVDRIKDIFKVLNNQVSPSELEGLVFNHPAVLDVGVVGIPDEDAINKPKALVVKKPEADVTEKELCDYVAGTTAKYKWLTGGVQFVSEIPKLPSGKIIRTQLQKMAVQPVETE